METIPVELELNLKNIIAESREVAQALNEFANDLERIEKKYADPRESITKEQKMRRCGRWTDDEL